jgi:hypothetical protein
MPAAWRRRRARPRRAGLPGCAGRVNEIHLLQRAEAALDAALAVGDAISAQALAGLSAAERKTLVALLRKAREGLLALNELEVADGTTHPTLPVSGA